MSDYMATTRTLRIKCSLILLAVVGLSVLLSPVALKLYRLRQQYRAVEMVTRLQGHVGRPGNPANVTRVSFGKVHQITDQDVAELVPRLKYLPNLKHIEIQSGKITDKGLAQLCELHSRETLIVYGAPITDDAITHVRDLAKVKTLMFRGERLTDKSLSTIAELPQLRELGLSSPAITDAGIQELANLPRLGMLHSFGTQTTPAGMRQLGAQIPRPLAVNDDNWATNAKVY